MQSKHLFAKLLFSISSKVFLIDRLLVFFQAHCFVFAWQFL
ncbi:hypothetical protein hp2017_0324 [Helicobacter pylori 2017]|nr:hypothetical protein hp2017_0324 [Helicobacter pylori 2017]